MREALVAHQARRAMAAAGVPRCRYHGTALGLAEFDCSTHVSTRTIVLFEWHTGIINT